MQNNALIFHIQHKNNYFQHNKQILSPTEAEAVLTAGGCSPCFMTRSPLAVVSYSATGDKWLQYTGMNKTQMFLRTLKLKVIAHSSLK